jgi:hypothetical protein
MSRLVAIVFSVVLLGLVAAPMFGRATADSYPLSSYPMFASDRGTVSTFYGAVGIEVDGERKVLGPQTVGGTSEIVHAAESVRFAVRSDTVESLCEEISERLDGEEFERVEVISERIDTLAWFDGDEVPLETTVHGECDVA